MEGYGSVEGRGSIGRRGGWALARNKMLPVLNFLKSVTLSA